MLSHLQLFDLEGSFVIIMCENVNIEIVKKESTSLVQTGYDKTRNCGENRLSVRSPAISNFFPFPLGLRSSGVRLYLLFVTFTVDEIKL